MKRQQRSTTSRALTLLTAILPLVAACSSSPDVPLGQEGNIAGFIGGVVADEPQAALVGRRVLASGGSAADAATAMGFAMAVTLPSRAGLGAGGACLAYDPKSTGPGGGNPEAILFPAVAPANPGRADRPASVPMLARGLVLLQARYGVLPVEGLMGPAEQYARLGVQVSRALLRDLAVVAGPLSADAGARSVFMHNGVPLREGDLLVQPELATTIAKLRQSGIGDLYQGQLAQRLVEAMPSAGGGLSISDLRVALPSFTPALQRAYNVQDSFAYLPANVPGGLATAAALEALIKNNTDLAGAQRRVAAIQGALRRGAAPEVALLDQSLPDADLGTLPASAVFGAVDHDGKAAMCAVSMGNLFGTGRVAQGTGILLGASPASKPAPLLSLAMMTNRALEGFRGAAGGTGQEAAPVAAAFGLLEGLQGHLPASPPEPGRADVLACTTILPKLNGGCGWSADPRGLGLAIGGN